MLSIGLLILTFPHFHLQRNTLIISFVSLIFPFNPFHPVDSHSSKLTFIIILAESLLQLHVRRQFNNHTTCLKQRWRAAHTAYPELLHETTMVLWSTDEREPLTGLATCFHGRALCFSSSGAWLKTPLSSPLHRQSQTSTFQTNLRGLVQNLPTTQKASLFTPIH